MMDVRRSATTLLESMDDSVVGEAKYMMRAHIGQWLICVRSYERVSTILHQSLAALTVHLTEDQLRQVLIFVAAEDRDVISGAYELALAGTRWSGRIVLGRAGADEQVKFIINCAPPGAHIVIMDDNVKHFLILSGGISRRMQPSELADVVAKPIQRQTHPAWVLLLRRKAETRNGSSADGAFAAMSHR